MIRTVQQGLLRVAITTGLVTTSGRWVEVGFSGC
jgi:hypothetical protein